MPETLSTMPENAWRLILKTLAVANLVAYGFGKADAEAEAEKFIQSCVPELGITAEVHRSWLIKVGMPENATSSEMIEFAQSRRAAIQK